MTLREKINEYAGKIPYVGNFLTYEINPKITARDIVTLGLITYLTFSAVNSAKAAKGSEEVMVGNKSTTVETKLGGDIISRIGLFTKIRNTVDYENKLKSFSIVDIIYPVINGVEGVTEMQLSSGSGFVPRVGLQYLRKFDNGRAFILSTGGINGGPNIETITDVRYNPKLSLSETVNLVTRIENVTKIDMVGNYSTIFRGRFGLSIKEVNGGIAVDAVKKENEKPKYNYGVFVQKDL